MTQGTLFPVRRAVRKPRLSPIARTSDDATSHLAGLEVTISGLRERQRNLVLQALTRFPGSTSHELARSAGIDRYAVARRLPEMLEAPARVRKGDRRTCAVSGKLARTWFPMEGGN